MAGNEAIMTQLDRLEALAETRTWTLGDTMFVTRTVLSDLIRVARAARNLVDVFGRLEGEPDSIDKLADALAPLFAEVES